MKRKIIKASPFVLVAVVFLFWLRIGLYADPDVVTVSPFTEATHLRIDPKSGLSFQKDLPSGNAIQVKIPGGAADSEVFIEAVAKKGVEIASRFPLPDGKLIADDLVVEMRLVPQSLVNIELDKRPELKKDAEFTFFYNNPTKSERENYGSVKLYAYNSSRQNWEVISNQTTKALNGAIIVTGHGKPGLVALVVETDKPQTNNQSALRRRLESLLQKLENLLRQLKVAGSK